MMIADSYEDMSARAALLVAGHVMVNPEIVLGLPAGGTPTGMHEKIVSLNREFHVERSRVTTFNLDEYLGLSPQDKESYRYYMETHFFSKIPVSRERINFLDGLAGEPVKECRRYDREIAKAGGIELQIPGTGRNGHTGFNEPSDSSRRRERPILVFFGTEKRFRNMLCLLELELS